MLKILKRKKLRKSQKPKPKNRIGYLLDVEYHGASEKAMFIFHDPATQSLFRWFDKSGHRSFLLTDATPEDADRILGDSPAYMYSEKVGRYNAILDKEVILTKVVAKDPLSIGGNRRGSYRSILTDEGFIVWEAWIQYVNNVCYDNGMEIGMGYTVTKERVIPLSDPETEKRISDIYGKILSEGIEESDILLDWIRMFEYDLPSIKISSLDIEVLPETPTTIPNPLIPEQPVITMSMVTSDGRRITLMLKRPGGIVGEGQIPGEVEFFDDERELILKTFELIKEYPMIVTFNGDDFDMLYLYNRATKLRIPKYMNPIYVSKRVCKLTSGIHIDLYPFMKNPSIKNYAFQGKYRDHSLEAISQALLGRGKIVNEKTIEWQTYVELGTYCLNDADLTYELFMFKGGLTLNLLLSLVRMSNLSIYQVSRNRISDWVRSTFYYVSRRKNWLIPTSDELKAKGEIQTTAKIEGKGYEGAIVRDPIPGIHFKVIVMDFASLYPSEVKKRNIGFATINCPHPECESNKVPYTTHHICTINRAIEAEIIGGLRDARIFFYKGQAKNEELSSDVRDFYDALQQAIKVYINASYGVFGSPTFALHCPPVAEAITAYGRRDMRASMTKAEEMGIEVLGGDTDSVFLNNPTVEQTAELQRWATDELDLDLSIDKAYRYAIFSTRKKNYLGVFASGDVDIKGLTGKKSHIPQIIKDPFFKCMKLLGDIQTMDDYDDIRYSIWKIIRDTYLKIQRREWDDISDLAFHTRLGMNINQYRGNPQHVKAAKMLVELGVPIKGGDVVDYIKATNDEGVMPLMGANPELVNLDVYLDQLESVFAQMIEPMEIDFNEDIRGKMSLLSYINEDGSLLLSYFMQHPEEKS